MGVHLPSKHAPRRAFLRVVPALLAAALALAAAMGSAPSSGATSSLRKPIAVVARALSLNLNATTHLIGRPGHVLNERGAFTGTITGSISIRFTSLTSNTGTGSFVAYTAGGSFHGQTYTKGHVVGATGYFTGTGSITGGTGRWAHARASNLQFSGVIDRQNLHSTSHLQGNMSV